MGAEALVDVQLFSLHGSDMRVVRNNIAHARKHAVRFEWYTLDALSVELERRVMSLYREWLAMHRMPELRNHLLPFPRHIDGRLLVAFKEDVLLGVWSFFPYQHGSGWMMDLMIRSPQSPRGLTEAAFVEAFAKARSEGVKEVSLGFCGKIVSDQRGTFRAGVENILRWWYGIAWLYRFEELVTFKQKFKPQFEPRYVVYPRLRDLGLIVAAVMADQYKK
jgi:lysyl-tRNA synthetase class 2